MARWRIADKGFFITTSVFTARATDEARRGGAPIDLVDGEALCDLLYEHGLGVEPRPVVVPERFADLLRAPGVGHKPLQ